MPANPSPLRRLLAALAADPTAGAWGEWARRLAADSATPAPSVKQLHAAGAVRRRKQVVK